MKNPMQKEEKVMQKYCTKDDLHPYECGGVDEKCIHCLAYKNSDINHIDKCELCNSEIWIDEGMKIVKCNQKSQPKETPWELSDTQPELEHQGWEIEKIEINSPKKKYTLTVAFKNQLELGIKINEIIDLLNKLKKD